MNKILIFISILGYSVVFSQEQNTSSNETFEAEKPSSFEKSAEFPIYPEGIDVFKRNFAKMIDWGKVNAKGKIKSEAQLIISEDGNITDIKVIGENKTMNKEMERVAKIMSRTKWTPAKLNGKPIKYRFKLPITMNFD